MEVFCPRGHAIPDDEIHYSNKSNEVGEDYFEVECLCPVCSSVFSTSQWGHLDNLEDAKEILIDKIKTY